MSARQQAGQLRAILTKNFKRSRVREAMVQTLRNNGQIASGALEKSILSISESRAFKLSYKINQEFDIIYDVQVSYQLEDTLGVPYATRVDTVLGREPARMKPSINAIERWILQKMSNGTWRGGNMYIMRRGNKTYSYPLSDFKYRKRLAYIIAKSIEDRGYLKTRSPYLTEGKLRQELAFLDAKNEFEALWEQELSLILGNKITALF